MSKTNNRLLMIAVIVIVAVVVFGVVAFWSSYSGENVRFETDQTLYKVMPDPAFNVLLNTLMQEPPCFGTPPPSGIRVTVEAGFVAEPYLAQVAFVSNQIVMGTITGIANATILGDGEVYTHYLFAPSLYLKGQPSKEGGGIITITKLGGKCGSYEMTVSPDFEIRVGEKYILFLSNRTGSTSIAYSFQGVYPVIDGKIYSLLSAGRGGLDIPTSRMVNGWSLEQFKAEIGKQIIISTITQTTTETLTIIVNGTSIATTTIQTTTTVVTSTASGSVTAETSTTEAKASTLTTIPSTVLPSATTATEQVTDSSVYAWVVGATAATIVLAVVLLLKRRPLLPGHG